MKKFLTVAALIWVFFLLQTSVCPLDCVWLDQTESFSHFGRIHRIYGGIQSRHVDRLCLWAFGDLFAANGVSLISQTCYGDLLGFYALLFCMSDIYRTGEPAFLSRRYQASADDDYRCRPLRQFRLLSDYVSDAGAP